jgi:hypothetical protein
MNRERLLKVVLVVVGLVFLAGVYPSEVSGRKASSRISTSQP